MILETAFQRTDIPLTALADVGSIVGTSPESDVAILWYDYGIRVRFGSLHR